MKNGYFYVLFILLTGFSTSLFSQQTYHEYVITQEAEVAEKTIENLLESGTRHLYSNPDKAREIARQALVLATESRNTDWQMKLLNFMGISHMIQSTYDSALYHYHRAKDLAMEAGSLTQMGNSINNIAVAHGDMGNFISSLRYFLRALDKYEQSGMGDQKAYIYNNIGMIYAEIENYPKALENYLLSHEIFYGLRDSIRIGTLLINLGNLHYNKGSVDLAMEYLDSALVYKKLTSDKYGQTSALEAKGRTLMAKGEFEEAENTYLMALEMARELGFDSGRASALTEMASLFLKTGKPEKALDNAEKAVEIASAINNNKLQYRAHKMLSRVYEELGEPILALEHFQKFNQLKDESINQTRLHQIYNLEMERTAEINLRELAEREELLSRKNTTIFLMTFAFIASFVILLLVYYLFMIRQKQKERRRQDQERLRLIRERARAAMKAEIMERKRLGLELHDGIGPMLSLAKLNVSGLLEKPDILPDRKTRILQNTAGTINQILREMKNISQNMAPMVLIEKGLESALKDMTSKLNETKKYHVSLDVTGINGKMDSFLEHALFRSVQEAINNTIMHAEASWINIQITGNHEDLTVMIEDNGKGFDVNELNQHGGLGLKSVTSRIESLGGQVYIDSVTGRGTIVTIIVPVTQKV